MKIRSKLIVGFSLMVSLTVFLGIITNSQSNIASNDYRSLADYDLLVIQNAEKLLKFTIDAETGQRGFIITGDETFLEPYNTGTKSFFNLIEVETDLVSGNPNQVKKLKYISELFSNWINQAALPEIELGRKIHQTQENDLELLLSSDSGRILLDEVYQIVFLLKEDLRETDNVDGFLLITKIENDVKDTESAQRGYLITGKDEFLVSFDNLKIELHENIQNLEINLSDDVENLQLIYSLDKIIQKWESEIVIPEIDSRRLMEQHPSLNQITLLIKEGTGKRILDEIRLEFDEFIQIEERLKEDNLDHALASQEITRYVIFIILIISAVSAAVMGFLIFYSISNTLSKLEKVVEKFKEGKYNEQIKIDSNDELEEFSKSFETIRTILLKKEKLKNIGELASRLAHDLRNPLTVIKGVSSLLETNIDDKDESGKKRIKMMNSAISRMTHQIDDVMDFVRVTEPKLENHSLLNLITSAISRTHVPELVDIQIPQNDIILKCDSVKLDIVLVNLLSNAIDAIKKQGMVKIRLIDDISTVRLEFEDSGLPINPDILPTIFEPLFTTKESGTGLGLASCKNIVEQHGGEIYITSNPTIVSVILSKNP